MKPLAVLLLVSLIALLGIRIISGYTNFLLAGCIGMSAMLLFTAIGHFAFGEGMTMMVPLFIPFRKQMVWVTGVLEILAATGLLMPAWRHYTAVFLILFFILLLPANIYAAAKKVNYQKGTYEGPGLTYLWFRVPLQVFFIAWAWYCC